MRRSFREPAEIVPNFHREDAASFRHRKSLRLNNLDSWEEV